MFKFKQHTAGKTSTLLAILLLGSTTAYGDIYKTVLPDGTVIYSDAPEQGAEQHSKKLEGIVDIPTLNLPPVKQNKPTSSSDSDTAPFNYDSVTITSPKSDQTFRNIGGSLTVSVSVQPALQQGHRVELMMDGSKVAGPSASTTLTAKEVYRGTHSFTARILDKSGKTVARSNSVTVHVHQNSAR